MKIVVLTSDGIRHKFFANSLDSKADSSLIISQSKQNDALKDNEPNSINEHFKLRDETEKFFFPNNYSFNSETLSIRYTDLNTNHILQKIKEFQPNMIFVFGSSIIKEPLLSLTTSIPTFNLHLGISPYYRGSGTNFWPFVNNELEYVGSTILHINSGIDTGDIICHTRPIIEVGDNVHSVGCKVIQTSVESLFQIIDMVTKKIEPTPIKQWSVENERYYKTTDFNEEILQKYKNNLENGLIENYLASPKKPIRLVTL